MGKIYCIGDIHGELAKLNTLLDKLDIQSTDTIVFLGDYVDRGPDSYGVIERLIKLREECSCIFLCGNHDQMFFEDTKYRSHLPLESNKLSGEGRYSLWSQGARETYKSYINAGVTPEAHFEFWEWMSSYATTTINGEKHLFVHGGYNRHKLLEEQKNDINYFLWDRDLIMAAKSYDGMINKRYKFKNKDGFKYIYVGHTPVQTWGLNTPQLWSNVWAMDTGLGKYPDSELYALEITTQTLIK
jgi:serine/threonine protein phosphatase 1